MKCSNNLSPVSNLTGLIFSPSALLRLNTNIKGRKSTQRSNITAAARTRLLWALCSSQNTPVDLTLIVNAQRLRCSWLESESLRGETPHSNSETVLVSFGMTRKHHIYNSKYVYKMAVNWGVGHLYCLRSIQELTIYFHLFLVMNCILYTR